MILRCGRDVELHRHPLILVQQRRNLRFVPRQAHDLGDHVLLYGIDVWAINGAGSSFQVGREPSLSVEWAASAPPGIVARDTTGARDLATETSVNARRLGTIYRGMMCARAGSMPTCRERDYRSQLLRAISIPTGDITLNDLQRVDSHRVAAALQKTESAEGKTSSGLSNHPLNAVAVKLHD